MKPQRRKLAASGVWDKGRDLIPALPSSISFLFPVPLQVVTFAVELTKKVKHELRGNNRGFYRMIKEIDYIKIATRMLLLF